LKVLRSSVGAVCLLLLCAAFADAQSFHAYFGMGTATDGNINQSLDLLGTGTAQPTSGMGGVFGTLGGGVMLKPSLGVGAEVSFRFAQGDYAGLGYRPIFYDFNAISTPNLGSKKIVPEFQGGFGGTSLRFYGGQAVCSYYTYSCSNFVGSSNHLQLHAGFGLRVFVTDHLYVRPMFDYHWVHGLYQYFTSDSVLEYSIAIGYSSSQ